MTTSAQLSAAQLESLKKAWHTLDPDNEGLVPRDVKRVLESLGFEPTDEELSGLLIEAVHEHYNAPTDCEDFCPVLARVYVGELQCTKVPSTLRVLTSRDSVHIPTT
jgi:Ca2+-binding EF-hand superfamily protein